MIILEHSAPILIAVMTCFAVLLAWWALWSFGTILHSITLESRPSERLVAGTQAFLKMLSLCVVWLILPVVLICSFFVIREPRPIQLSPEIAPFIPPPIVVSSIFVVAFAGLLLWLRSARELLQINAETDSELKKRRQSLERTRNVSYCVFGFALFFGVSLLNIINIVNSFSDRSTFAETHPFEHRAESNEANRESYIDNQFAQLGPHVQILLRSNDDDQ